MKKLFLILLLGNIALFAVMQSGSFVLGDQGGQPQPYLNGELIRLIPPPQSTLAKSLPAQAPVSAQTPLPAPASAASLSAQTPLPAPISVASVSAPAAVSPAAEPGSSPPQATANPPLTMQMDALTVARSDELVCLEWGGFSGTGLTQAAAALSTLQLGDKLARRQIEHDTGFWVYIPPLRSKAAVNRKIGELRELGIKEYFAVQTPGPWLNAISLGVFKTRDSAQNFLDHLRAKGVRSAKVGEHASKLKATAFVLKGVDPPTVDKLTEMQRDFAGSELNKVPCALTN